MKSIRKWAAGIAAWGVMALPAAAMAESVRFHVDALGQTHEKIQLFMANAPRDFDFAAAPAYDGVDAQFEISGLTQGQTYRFCARLVRGAEVSQISNIITYRVPVVLQFKAPVLIKIDPIAE